MYVTISCDAPECSKTVTFMATPEGQVEAIKNNPWLNSLRTVVMPDVVPGTNEQRKLGYCSDECETKGILTGTHNKLEPKVIVPPGGQAGVDLAAQAAARAAAATQHLKQGKGITVAQG